MTQVVRSKHPARQRERALNEVDGAGVDGLGLAPNKRILQVWRLLRTRAGVHDPKGCSEVQLEDLLVDLRTVDPIVTRQADRNRRRSRGHLNLPRVDRQNNTSL